MQASRLLRDCNFACAGRFKMACEPIQTTDRPSQKVPIWTEQAESADGVDKVRCHGSSFPSPSLGFGLFETISVESRGVGGSSSRLMVCRV